MTTAAQGHGLGGRLAALVAALAVAYVVFEAAFAEAFGPLSRHMAQHIFLMNLVAPALALAVAPAIAGRRVSLSALAAATASQILLLWAWHAPPAMSATSASVPLMAAMHASLFAAALLFWLAVFAQRGARRWGSILAVLITGKLFCLLGALFVFAPRALFATGGAAHAHHAAVPAALDDQQLAGLMMIVACPLTYVLAGVVIAARWLDDLEASDACHKGPVAGMARP